MPAKKKKKEHAERKEQKREKKKFCAGVEREKAKSKRMIGRN